MTPSAKSGCFSRVKSGNNVGNNCKLMLPNNLIICDHKCNQKITDGQNLKLELYKLYKNAPTIKYNIHYMYQ